MRERGASAFLCNRKFLGIQGTFFFIKKERLGQKTPGGKIYSSAWS